VRSRYPAAIDETITTCYRHPGRETGRACTRCGRPACSECLVQAAVGSQCVECLRASRPPATERLRRWNAAQGSIVTKVIIAINLAMVVVTSISGGGGNLLSGGYTQVHIDYALFGPSVANGEWYRLVTAGFLHYGLLHAGLNCWFIWIVGGQLERALGGWRYICVYFASLLAGSAGALLVTPRALTAGASGAAFGLMGCMLVGYRQRGIPVLRSNLGMVLILNLALTFTFSGISIGGHIGGLAGGALCGTVLLHPGKHPKWWDTAVPVAVAVVAVVVALAAASAST
jgi:membrane associated rhomboid family serine protease